MKYISNIFPIENLQAISAQYRIYDIKGLRKSNKDYQSNKQILIEKLSRSLKHPVLVIEIDNEPKLIVRNDETTISKIKSEYDFGRLNIFLNLTDSIFDIDFLNPTDNVKKICTRFLQFDMNSQLKNSPNLWQPYTGGPFFLKQFESIENIAIYKGFIFRVIEIPDGGFGIIIDVTRKFASENPLDVYISKKDFMNKYKRSKESKSFIYRYSDWYEIRPTEHDDFNVSEFKVNGIPLIDHIRETIPRPHSTELANLPSDSSVLTYYTNNGETRGAPAGLLYEVFDFQDTNHPWANKKSIIPPQQRFFEIQDFRTNYFNKIKFGQTFLNLSHKSVEIPKRNFSFPNFQLGNQFILDSSQFSNPRELTRQRMNKLLDTSVGFFSRSNLPNQILVIPRSIHDTSGGTFIQMLSDTVNKMYPSDSYRPEIISYEDKFKDGTDYVAVGRYIVDAVVNGYKRIGPGYGMVMIPRLERKAKREHDKLSALVTRELKARNVICSIIHTDIIQTCFEHKTTKEGKSYYDIKYDNRDKYRKKLNGYLRNITISKILLNCSKWPFILNNPLSADLTIGIDVKHSTAGFIIIDKNGKNIRTELEESRNKEKLSTEQIEARIYEIIKKEIEIDPTSQLNKIVIHRDGRLYDSELEGLFNALKRLKSDLIISDKADLSILEIPKTSFLALRFFEMRRNENNSSIELENPPNGLVFYLTNEAFVCTTGKEFSHEGTSNPLYVKFNYCSMSHEDLMRDLFYLTTLAFTKPDDCSRYPITTKINDLRLSDAASEYDSDSFKYSEIISENVRSY